MAIHREQTAVKLDAAETQGFTETLRAMINTARDQHKQTLVDYAITYLRDKGEDTALIEQIPLEQVVAFQQQDKDGNLLESILVIFNEEWPAGEEPVTTEDPGTANPDPTV